MNRLLCLVLCAACAQTRLAPLHTNQALDADERELFREADEQDARFARSGVLYDDQALDAYLEEVASRLGRASGSQFHFRVHTVRSPYVNAFTLPNGSIYVHLGLLARIDDEAQLAVVLAHEMAHAIHRHATRLRRDASNKLDLGAFLPGIGTLAAMLSVNGYSRELETEADEVGFGLVAAAGYDVREGRKLFEKIDEERREQKEKEPFFFATHPALAVRVANFRRLEAAGPPMGDRDEASFAIRMKAPVYAAALLDLQQGRLDSALRSARRCEELEPGSAHAPYLRGEVLRQRDDFAAAIAQYREAVTLDASFAEAWRPLGLLLLKRGEREPARDAFRRYLALAPEAKDRAYVERDLESLR